MPSIIFSRLVWAIVLVLLQPLVFNHIHLFGYATPLPYVYALLILPSTTPRWLYVVLGFVLGFVVDFFSNTFGMAAAATTFAGLCTPFLLKFFGPKDFDPDNLLLPSFESLETKNFLFYAAALLFVHACVFFTLEAMTFNHFSGLIFNMFGSTALSLLFVSLFELIRKH